MKKISLKDLGVAYSLANLWFITEWKKIIYTSNSEYFHFEPRSIFEYLAILVDVLLLTVVFFAIIRLSSFISRIWIRRIFQVVFLVLGVVAFGGLSREIIKWASPDTINFVNLPLPVIVLFICLLFAAKDKFRLDKITENLKSLTHFLLPFSLLIFFQLFYTKITADPNTYLPQSVEKVISTNQSPQPSKKIVWIIFDELDYAALTTANRNNTNLPEFNRLMNQSFVAQNALAPDELTLKSIPALLTGKPLGSVDIISPNDLRLVSPIESEPFTLRESSNIFTELESLSGKSAIVGWYHPYSRIFRDNVSYAFWSPYRETSCSGLSEFAACSINIFIESLINIPLVVRLFPSLWTTNVSFQNEDYATQIERNWFLSVKADELISNPGLNLLFFHFSIPHAPFLGRTDLQGKETYFNALEAADDLVKRLRETLEKAGQWDDTVLIISSDHRLRYKRLNDFMFLPENQRQAAVDDIRIPFSIKLAGQKNRYDYEQPFNTVITKELILAIFKEEIKKPEDLAFWLENLRVTQPDLINFRPEIKKF